MTPDRGVENPRSITDLGRWPGYLAGALTETGYVAALMLIALAIAVVAKVVWP